MGNSKKYIALFILIGFSIISCLPKRTNQKTPIVMPRYPIDTVGVNRITIKIEGEELQNVEDSCHFYTLTNGLIEISSILDTNRLYADTINGMTSNPNMVIDSFIIFTKDTTYHLMIDSIADNSTSNNLYRYKILDLPLPDSLFLNCYESCIDIAYRVRLLETDDDLSVRHFSHKLIVHNKDDKIIWADIAFNADSYPNHYSPYNKIDYSISESAKVLIKVYNICGQVVDTVINEVQLSGHYVKEWDFANQPNGIYFVQIKIGDSTVVKKLLVLK